MPTLLDSLVQWIPSFTYAYYEIQLKKIISHKQHCFVPLSGSFWSSNWPHDAKYLSAFWGHCSICWEPLISTKPSKSIAIVKLYIVYMVRVVFSQRVMKTIGACFDIFTASVRYDVHFLLQSFLTESSRPSLLSYSRLSYWTQPVKVEPASTVDVCRGREVWIHREENAQLKKKGQRSHFSLWCD